MLLIVEQESIFFLQNDQFEEVEKKIKNGTLFELQNCQPQSETYYKQFLNFVLKYSTLNMLKWMIENDFIITVDDELLCCAIEYGRLDFVRFLFSEKFLKPPCQVLAQKVIMHSRDHNQLEIIEWFYDTYPICRIVKIGEYRIRSNDCVEFFKTLYEKKFTRIDCLHATDAIFFCDENITISFFNWILSKEPDFKFSLNSITNAIMEDKLEIVKWFHLTKNIKWTKDNTNPFEPTNLNLLPIHVACSRGNIVMINWLYDNRKSNLFTSSGVLDAARFGHIHVLYWILEKYGKKPFLDYTIANTPLSVHVRKWFEKNILQQS